MKIGEVINDFDVSKQMKAKLISKDIIKFKEADFTKIELREREEIQRDIEKTRKNIHTS